MACISNGGADSRELTCILRQRIILKITYLYQNNMDSRMISKTKLRQQIESLPEEFSIDELIDRLLLIEKVEIGIEQSKNQEIISDAEMSNEIKKWFE